MGETILGNRYEIIRKIGDGGMAFVYEAKDRLLNRIVAVKVLRPEFVDDEEFLAKFKREAEAVANISHPNIVNVYDVGCDGKVNYIVMEYVDGQNLKEIIKNEGISEEKFNAAMVLRNNILKIASINTLVGEDEDSELINFIEDYEYFLEDEVLRSILKEDLQKAISELKENEQFVLNMRFGLEDGRAKTLEEVGQAYGVTRERIRQIEVKALGKLRKSKKAKYLREYLIEG